MFVVAGEGKFNQGKLGPIYVIVEDILWPPPLRLAQMGCLCPPHSHRPEHFVRGRWKIGSDTTSGLRHKHSTFSLPHPDLH